jgi:hypothetical protein
MVRAGARHTSGFLDRYPTLDSCGSARHADKRRASHFSTSSEVAFKEVAHAAQEVRMVSPFPERSPQPQRIFIEPEDVRKRLTAFGMTPEMLVHSIEAGDLARRPAMQPVYPATFAGVTMWAQTLAELRRQLLQRRDGYKIGRTGNYETVYSAERRIAFAVNAGDGNTGIDGKRDPRLTRPKGVKTTERIARNIRDTQLTLIEFPDPELPADEACETWFLLVRPTKTEIRLELSCPRKIGPDGIVDGWHERIILPPVPISGAVAPIEPDDGGDDGSDGEALVQR